MPPTPFPHPDTCRSRGWQIPVQVVKYVFMKICKKVMVGAGVAACVLGSMANEGARQDVKRTEFAPLSRTGGVDESAVVEHEE